MLPSSSLTILVICLAVVLPVVAILAIFVICCVWRRIDESQTEIRDKHYRTDQLMQANDAAEEAIAAHMAARQQQQMYPGAQVYPVGGQVYPAQYTPATLGAGYQQQMVYPAQQYGQPAVVLAPHNNYPQ